MSCKTGENLEFYVKNKQKQMLASVYLSRLSLFSPEKRREHYFSFLFQSQKKRLVKLLVVNQWLM